MATSRYFMNPRPQNATQRTMWYVAQHRKHSCTGGSTRRYAANANGAVSYLRVSVPSQLTLRLLSSYAAPQITTTRTGRVTITLTSYTVPPPPPPHLRPPLPPLTLPRNSAKISWVVLEGASLNSFLFCFNIFGEIYVMLWPVKEEINVDINACPNCSSPIRSPYLTTKR